MAATHPSETATGTVPKDARALWIVEKGRPAILPVRLPESEHLVEIETLCSAISRGTEALVLAGNVPESEHERMRCPFQEGSFTFPVKYGYSAVGIVRKGPAELAGRTVFVLHPHQDRFRVDPEMVVPVPETMPPERAALAANMETALNVVWDGRISPGDRVAVVGGGTVGLLAAWLAARIPATAVTLVDVQPDRSRLAARLGCDFALPADCPADCDLVIHASATSEGLATALAAAGSEATVIEASWYGRRSVAAPLGGAFHSRRLRLISSQVGDLPPWRRPRWSRRRRLELSLSLLADTALDMLLSGETSFSEIADAYPAILAEPTTLCHLIRY
jgi:threonine dehydrogenase-like Zn-dependent dehydrogenase